LPDSDREALEAYLESGPSDGDGPLASADPIGSWSFESSNVDGDTVTDRSGNGHDGSIVGGVTPGVEGPAAAEGGGATFNGEDGTVVVPDDGDALDPSAYTVSAWARTDGAGFYSAILGKSESMWNGHLEDTSQPRLDPYDATEDVDPIASETAYNDGEWHHIVYWHDPDNGSAIYLDGEQVASTDEAVASPASGNDLAIGSKSDESDYYSGDIADVRLYGEPLSEEQITALFEGETGGDDGGVTEGLVAR
jgi:hypothetical protein